MGKTARQDYDDYEKEWEQICTIAVNYYGEDLYENFLSHCYFEKVIKNIAILKAPTRHIKVSLENYYKKKLERLWHKLNDSIQAIDIQVGRNIEDCPKAKKEYAQVIQLPLWADAVRGTPNSVLRGALFAAIIPNKRKAFEREIIVNEKDLKIVFTGWQLDQADRDVWEQALHMARQQPLGKSIYFSARSFLKSLGRGTGKSQHEWLKKSFARLIGCGVEITHSNYTYGGSLLDFERDDETQQYKISFNPKIMQLYSAGWTQSDFEDRKKIGSKKFLALWLHGYISSHVIIYPTKVETFLRMSGSSNSSIYDFKYKIKQALKRLQEIDVIKTYYISDKNLVHIEKYPSSCQKRYLQHVDTHE